MLKKMFLVLGIMMVFFVVTPKNIYACKTNDGKDRPVGSFTCGEQTGTANNVYRCDSKPVTILLVTIMKEEWTLLGTCATCVNDSVNNTAGCSGGEAINVAALSIKNQYSPFDACGPTKIETAIGCVPIAIEEFVPWLLTLVFGIAGGIAFLLMVYGFILISTSGGDEKKIQGAKETITSAIVGLLVCIFSIFILRLITVSILQIPGIN
jgi:hypothetical protein